MEAQARAERSEPFVRQHASGEVFVADNLEAARSMCPVLGKLSLEDAGLLLELEAMGKELKAADQVATTPVIEQQAAKPEPKPAASDKPVTLTRKRELTEVVEPKAKTSVVPIATETVDRSVIEVAPEEPPAELPAPLTEPLTRLVKPPVIKQPVELARPVEVPVAPVEQPVAELPAVPAIQPEAARVVEAATIVPSVPVEPRQELPVTVQEIAPLSEPVALVEHLQRPVTFEPPAEEIAELLPVLYEVPAEVIEVSAELSVLPVELDLTADEMLATDPEQPAAEPIEMVEATEVAPAMPAVEVPAAQAEPSLEPLAYLEPADILEVSVAQPELELPAPALPAPVEQIEVVAVRLAEVLAQAPITPDEPQASSRILAEIIEVAALPLATAAEPIETIPTPVITAAAAPIEQKVEQKEIEQKLEALFVELFEEANIEYDVALLQSLVTITRRGSLGLLLETAAKEGGSLEVLLREFGTQEHLQKRQWPYSLQTMKQTVIHCYEIGRSALDLYRQRELATQGSVS